jgi:hypothetical protein
MNTADGALMRSHKLAVLGFEGAALLQPDGTVRGGRDELGIDVLRDDVWVTLGDLRPRISRLGAAPAWLLKFRSGDGDIALQYSAHNVDNVAVILIELRNESSGPVGLRWRGLGCIDTDLRQSRGTTPAGRAWSSAISINDQGHMSLLHHGTARIVMSMAVGLMPPASALAVDVADSLRGWERMVDQWAQLDNPELTRVESWRAMLADVAVYASVPPRQLAFTRVCRELQLAAQLSVEPVTTAYADDLLARQLLDGSWLPDGEISTDRQIEATVDALSAMAIAMRSIDAQSHDVLAKSIETAIGNAALWLERNAPTRTWLRRRAQSVPAVVVAALAQAGAALTDCAKDEDRVADGRAITSLAEQLVGVVVNHDVPTLTGSPVDAWILTDVATRTLTLFADPRQVGNQNVSIGPIVTLLGTVNVAVRWHGERAALLWEIVGTDEPVTLRTGLDPTWHRLVDAQSGSFVGQTLV